MTTKLKKQLFTLIMLIFSAAESYGLYWVWYNQTDRSVPATGVMIVLWLLVMLVMGIMWAVVMDEPEDRHDWKE